MPKEFKKEKPHKFDGEVKKVEEEQSFQLGMKKYFKVHDYFENMKSRLAISF